MAAENLTTLTQCSLCRNFQHCTAAGYCNCGAYGAREGQPMNNQPARLEATALLASLRDEERRNDHGLGGLLACAADEIERLREAIHLALGFHQTTHIHAALREALK